MKISVTAVENAAHEAPLLLRGDFYRSIEEAIAVGFAGMEIHLRKAGQVDWARLAAYCAARRFAISTIGTGLGFVLDKLSLSDADREARHSAAARIKEHIDLGNKLGCGVIIGSMQGKVPAGERYERFEGYFLESMKQLADYAHRKEVPLFLEAINRYESNFLNTAAQVMHIIDQIGSPLVLVHLDTFHMNIEEADMTVSIVDCGARLGHMHFADSNRRYPGAGHLDFRPVIAALESIDYRGYAALECTTYPEPFQAVKKGLAYLDPMLKHRANRD